MHIILIYTITLSFLLTPIQTLASSENENRKPTGEEQTKTEEKEKVKKVAKVSAMFVATTALLIMYFKSQKKKPINSSQPEPSTSTLLSPSQIALASASQRNSSAPKPVVKQPEQKKAIKPSKKIGSLGPHKVKEAALKQHFENAILPTLGKPLHRKSKTLGIDDLGEVGKNLDLTTQFSTSLVEGETSISLARKLKKDHPDDKIAVLNFARREKDHVGGLVSQGKLNQEESLCRTTNLYTQLKACAAEREEKNTDPPEEVGYFAHNEVIYSDGVTILYEEDDYQEEIGQLVKLPEGEQVEINVITSAAYNLNPAFNGNDIDQITKLPTDLDPQKAMREGVQSFFEHYLDNGDGDGTKLLIDLFQSEYVKFPGKKSVERWEQEKFFFMKRMKHMIEKWFYVLRAAQQNNVQHLILGAWGCGAYKNDPLESAQAFVEALKLIEGPFTTQIHFVFPTFGGKTAQFHQEFSDVFTAPANQRKIQLN